MASGPNWNPRRGTFYVQYWDGVWKRETVTRPTKKRRPTDPLIPSPKTVPPEAKAAFIRLAEVERVARLRSPGRSLLVESLADFLTEHTESYRTTSKPSIDRACKHFLAWCKVQKIDRIDGVTTHVCARWMEDRSRIVEPTTLKRERAQIARAWNKAVRRKALPDNPWIGADLPVKITRKKRGSWSRDQFNQLLAQCRPWLQDILIVGCNTGLRISALLRLRWDDVKWRSEAGVGYGWITVLPENDKAGKGYRVPMSRDCHEVLARRFGSNDPDFVITGDNGKRLIQRTSVAVAIDRACIRAKLKEPDSPNHHMRRTFGRWAVFGHLTGKPVPLTVVSGWMGHSSVKTTMIYLDVTDDDSTRFMVPDEDTLPPATTHS